MLETAVKFVLDILLENEEVKRFPKDFVTAATKWVRSWFLVDENSPTAAILASPEASVEEKSAVIREQAKILMENPKFQQELAEKMQEYSGYFQDLEQKGLWERLNLLIYKRQNIQRARDLETDAAVAFKYDALLKELDTEITKVKNLLQI